MVATGNRRVQNTVPVPVPLQTRAVYLRGHSLPCHSLHALWSHGKEFIPTNLYVNLMIMIKNVIFCVAKAKVNDPDGEFWIILLGTDQLEELFSIP